METEQMTAASLLSAFEPPLSPDVLLQMEVNLHLPGHSEEAALYVALRVGVDRMYVVRSLPLFLRAMERGEPVSFGKGFTFEPASMRFDRVDSRILKILSEIEAAQRPCEAQGYHMPQSGKFMPLGGESAKRILWLLMARPFRLVLGREILPSGPIERVRLPIACSLCEEGKGLMMRVTMPVDIRPITPDYLFVYSNGLLCQLSRPQRRFARALSPYLKGGQAEFHFAARDALQVISEIMPQMESACDITLTDTLGARIRREPLKARAYIDREAERVVARIAFHYGDTIIDPFAKFASGETDGMLLVRDASAEHSVLEVLSNAGFHVREGRVYLSNSRRVLAFITEGVQALQKVADVYASEAFGRMKPRRPKLSGRLAMSDGTLWLTLSDNDTPLEELAGLMQAFRDKKKYFRLKDGDFLDLRGLENWEELADMLEDVREEEDQPAAASEAGMTLRTYRAAYLVALLSGSKLPVSVDEKVKELSAALSRTGEPCPAEIAETLRPYQERGFQWIQALYMLRMGGVLADDMGLGKTIQTIAALIWAKRRDGAQPSLVVAPTSLLYNWQAELIKFAPELSVRVIEGDQRARAAYWNALLETGDTDVIITSYPLLRRDIPLMGNIPFRFVILDEAQHIKNPQSLSAISAGRLKGQIRLALTGTPMENNPGELWSIFNFVLPGYLAALPQFMRRFGDGTGAQGLARRIRPFLLRRLKSEVLPELPDKIESRVLVDMTAQQKNVYAAATLQLRERVERVLASKGLGRGRMEVLSAITKLRQICCHPSLVMDGYTGASGKQDALGEILDGALGSGRRVLLFSQFVTMLDILRRQLDARGISSLYLDGKTPVTQRMELVNRFNEGDTQVFLISLKAGGAGLNLTGADMVIHYDPWWNPAAEDQATDRAHRIGQKRVVQVIRLITRGTIEEQVARLSEHKRALFNAVVIAGEQMPSDLTEEEIMSLFA